MQDQGKEILEENDLFVCIVCWVVHSVLGIMTFSQLSVNRKMHHLYTLYLFNFSLHLLKRLIRLMGLFLVQVYHPNIDLEGNVCLNILREDWKPVFW
jgi:hypothetical protein